MREHNLLYEGVLTLKVQKGKNIDLQVILLEDMLVLLQRTNDDKYLLKCHYGLVQQGKDDTKVTYNPIISFSELYIRDVATGECGIQLCWVGGGGCWGGSGLCGREGDVRWFSALCSGFYYYY